MEHIATTSTSVAIEHVRIASERSFDEVKIALESSLPVLDDRIVQMLVSGDQEGIRRWERSGPKLVLFLVRDHGALLSSGSVRKKAVQYEIGNPLTASKMTRHHLGAALYAPLRVALLETEEGKVHFEYDLPSSLFGQFGDANVLEVARELDKDIHSVLVEAAR